MSKQKIKVTAAFRRKVMILRNNLVKANPFASSGFSTRSEYLSHLTKKAWSTVRADYDKLFILRATTLKGEYRSYLVYIDWINYNTVKGTGRPVGPDRQIFTVAALEISRKYSTKSFYKANILTLAA